MKTVKKLAALLAAVAACTALCGCGTIGNVGAIYANADLYTAGSAEFSAELTALDVDWPSGSVNLLCHDGDTVVISETAALEIPEDYAVRWFLDGTTLRVRFCKSGAVPVACPEKTLTLTIPRSAVLNGVGLSCASAAAELTELTADTVNVSTASGRVDLISCTGSTLEVSTASGAVAMSSGDWSDASVSTTSGNVEISALAAADRLHISTTSGAVSADCAAADRFSVSSTSGRVSLSVGSFRSGEVSSTSGALSLAAGCTPEALDMSAVSGSITLLLPDAAGFTADVDTVSGSFSSELPVSLRNETYVHGDGSARFSLNTVSGDISIRSE